ncbi:hypothetical protein [Frankia sp. AiPa1]|uniref:hypothetical protein n=1 Tax=Frankia sp. AiPa1 TaxID=573492 RepID=UPI00202B0615|nr:hypothetical protein [Frankia sp. AiPa1]MCL9758984.1 hypothetical protein [Frankia sp. AiPa1]
MTNMWSRHVRTTGRPTGAATVTGARLGQADRSVVVTGGVPTAAMAAGEDWG